MVFLHVDPDISLVCIYVGRFLLIMQIQMDSY